MDLLPDNGDEFSSETRDVSPANLLIKIESFSLLSEYGIRVYESREFDAGGYKWCVNPDSLSWINSVAKTYGEELVEYTPCFGRRLIIYPEGYDHDGKGEVGGYVSVYLSAAGTSHLPVDWEVNAIFSIFLYNQISDNYLCFRGKARRFHAVNPKWGFPKLISKERLRDPSNGYLVDDSCVFGAEVFVIKSQRIMESLCLVKTTPLKREWEISQFSQLGAVWESEEIGNADFQWKVRLYTKGMGSGLNRYVSIFVECVDAKRFAAHEKVKAKIRLAIKNKFLLDDHISKSYTHWFTSASTSLGYSEFIALSKMGESEKGFVVGDAFSLRVEICVQAFARDATMPLSPTE